jgi:hypothetical protein
MNVDYVMRRAFADRGVSDEALDWPRLTLQLAFCAGPGADYSIAATLAAINNESDDNVAYLTTALDVGAFDWSSLDFARLTPELRSRLISLPTEAAGIARARKSIVDYVGKAFA